MRILLNQSSFIASLPSSFVTVAAPPPTPLLKWQELDWQEESHPLLAHRHLSHAPEEHRQQCSLRLAAGWDEEGERGRFFGDFSGADFSSFSSCSPSTSETSPAGEAGRWKSSVVVTDEESESEETSLLRAKKKIRKRSKTKKQRNKALNGNIQANTYMMMWWSWNDSPFHQLRQERQKQRQQQHKHQEMKGAKHPDSIPTNTDPETDPGTAFEPA